MRDEQLAHQPPQHLFRHLGESRRGFDHGIADTGKFFDERRNADLRIDQCRPLGNAGRADFDDADFGDTIVDDATAGGFQIDKYDGLVKHQPPALPSKAPILSALANGDKLGANSA